MNNLPTSALKRASLALLSAAALTASITTAADPAPSAGTRPAFVQSTYASPEEAARALADAMRSDERRQIWRVLGPGASKFIRSGDPVQDDNARDAFVAAYDKAVKFERSGDAKATLVIGPDDFPFPYPLVLKNGRWQFDARQGNEQVLDRRIGRNELAAIKVCQAYVDAQREYAALDRDGNGVLEYAQKLASTPGAHDGLFWPTNEGEPPSPLGRLAASARTQGNGRLAGGTPYHGYFYKILTGQGNDARGGAYDYIVKGRMIGGFGLVAYPARWGHSGVMTFVCNHDGVVYEKNLGGGTATAAMEMTLFNPDATWVKSMDQ